MDTATVDGGPMQTCCFACRFFCPEACLSAEHLTPADWDECLMGDCRRTSPQVGRFRSENEYMRYDYGQWPLVQACGWCGEFRPRDGAEERVAEDLGHQPDQDKAQSEGGYVATAAIKE